MPRVLMGNIEVMRSSISFAALLVNVTANSSEGLICPVCINHTIRVVNTFVLPEPAPAKTKTEELEWVVASSCGWLSPFSISDIYWVLTVFNVISWRVQDGHLRRVY